MLLHFMLVGLIFTCKGKLVVSEITGHFLVLEKMNSFMLEGISYMVDDCNVTCD